MVRGWGLFFFLHGISSFGVVYFVLVVRPWSFYPRDDCCGGFGLVLLCHTLFVSGCARGHTSLALFVPSGLRFVCLVAVVCSPAACGSLPSVSRGFPSYHHFFPRGLPTRYSLIPSLFRSAVLVASCSACVLWRCPHFLQRWRPIGRACSGKEKGWRSFWLLGALALHASPSAVALVVYIHTFCCLRRHICARAYLLLFLCLWVLVLRVVCGGGLFGGGYVSLFIPCRACGGSIGVCMHGHTSWLGVRGHFCMCFMVWCAFLNFSVWRFALGWSFPLVTLTHLACPMASLSHACGG